MNRDQLVLEWTRMKPRTERINKVKVPGNNKISWYDRRCVVSANFTKPGKLASHVKYILRDKAFENPETEKKLFTSNDKINLNEIKNEKKIYRIVISPENADQLRDMEQTVKDIMDEVSKKQGQRLQWSAVIHTNTDHKHAHVVVRGVDLDNKQIPRLKDELMKGGMYKIASKQVTKELGQRNTQDFIDQFEKEINSDRFTGLDSQIKKNLNKKNVFQIDKFDSYTSQRAEYLVEKGLAKFNPLRNSYTMCESWESDLKNEQINKDIMKRMHREYDIKPEETKIFQYDGESRIKGEVVKKGIDNELYDRSFVIIKSHETGDHIYFSDKDTNKYREGQNVKIDSDGIRVDHSKKHEKSRGIEL